MEQTSQEFEGWAILELMGHRRVAGYVKPQEIAGAGFLRVDIPPLADGGALTQFYSPQAGGRVLDGRTWDEYPEPAPP